MINIAYFNIQLRYFNQKPISKKVREVNSLTIFFIYEM